MRLRKKSDHFRLVFQSDFFFSCERLGLISLGYLWEKNQKKLLNEMVNSDLNAIIVKVACMGLNEKHLGNFCYKLQSKNKEKR